MDPLPQMFPSLFGLFLLMAAAYTLYSSETIWKQLLVLRVTDTGPEGSILSFLIENATVPLWFYCGPTRAEMMTQWSQQRRHLKLVRVFIKDQYSDNLLAPSMILTHEKNPFKLQEWTINVFLRCFTGPNLPNGDKWYWIHHSWVHWKLWTRATAWVKSKFLIHQHLTVGKEHIACTYLNNKSASPAVLSSAVQRHCACRNQQHCDYTPGVRASWKQKTGCWDSCTLSSQAREAPDWLAWRHEWNVEPFGGRRASGGVVLLDSDST